MSPQELLLFTRWRDHRDADAFNTLVSMYAGLVYATCQRILRNGAEAEEISQECFLRLAQERDTVHTSLGGWLHQVATTRSLDRLRGNTRRRAREEIYASRANTVAEPTWNDIQEFVDRAIENLPDEERDVIVGHFLSRKTKVELAKDLGLSRRTVAKRIERGIAAIRSELDEKSVTITGVLFTTLFTSHAAEAAPIALTSVLGKLALTGGVRDALLPATVVKSGTIAGGTLLMKTKLALVAAALILLSVGVGVYRNLDDTPNATPVEPVQSSSSESEPQPGQIANEVPPPIQNTRSEPATPEALPATNVETPVLAVSRTLITDPNEYVSISGFTQDQDGYPIAGASVTVGPGWFDSDVDAGVIHFQTLSDDQGRFRVENINYTGTYYVFASKSGYTESWSGTEAGQELRIKPGDEIKDVSLVLKTGTTLTGRVSNTSGAPVPDATVRVTMAKLGIVTTLAHYAMAYTDDNGQFTLTFEKPGWTSVRVHSEDHGFGIFEKIPIQADEIVELQLREKARIYGKITRNDDTPAAEVDIRLLSTGERLNTVTDQLGMYSLDVQSEVGYRASVHLKDSFQLTDNINLDPLNAGEEREWNMVVPEKPITVHGRLIGMPSGKPITEVIPFLDVLRYWKNGREKISMNFRIDEGRYTAQILGGDGRYRFQLRYMINSDEGASGPMTTAIEIGEGEEVELDIQIPEPLEVNVEVVDYTGNPVEGAAVITQTDNNGSMNARLRTDASGRLDDPILVAPYGGFYVEARKTGYAPARGPHHFDDQPGTVLPMETLVLWPAGGIEGTVVADDGSPWPNVNLNIQLIQAGGTITTVSTTTDADGHFTVIDEIPATEVSMELRAEIGTGRRARVIGYWSGENISPPDAHIVDLGVIKLRSE
jgi:RNA polymerase sigma factor (sigma-70 family)